MFIMRALHLKIVLLIVSWGCFSTWFNIVSAKDFVVVIDAGHGGHDAGAVGKTSKEKNINLKVALTVGKLIENSDRNIKVIYTRKKDVFVTLQERAQVANKNKADLFISIHTNALAKGRTIQGTETYTLGLHRTQENLEVAKKENSVILIEDDYQARYAGFNPNSSESYIMFEFMQDKNMKQSVQLATLIQKQFKSTARRIDRGVRQAGFLVLHATCMPSVLVELGYISTPEEERYLNSQTGVNAMSRSICQAVLNYKNAQTSFSSLATIAESIESIPEAKISDLHQESTTGKVDTFRPSTPAQAKSTDGNQAKPQGGSKTNNVSNENKAIAQTRPQTQNTENSRIKVQPLNNKKNNPPETNKPVFKIQILTSSTLLKKNDRKLKGYSPVNYYKENGVYKYTYGESTNYNDILRLKRKTSATFKDAFIIAFRNGKKMNVQEAIQEFKRNR